MIDVTYVDGLASRARERPDGVALRDGTGTLTHSQLDGRVDAAASVLRASGVGQGSRVALLAADSVGTIVHLHAVWRLGAIHIPLNRRATRSELRGQLADIRAEVLAHDADHAATANELRSDALRLSSLADQVPDPAAPLVGQGDGRNAGLAAPAAIIFTSGTSGRPKGCVLTHANLAASADAWAERLDPRSTDVWLACLPLFHVAGLAIVMRAHRWGVPLRIHRRFDAAAVNAEIDDGVSHLSLVPEMLRQLLDERGRRPAASTLRTILLGGGPIDASLLERSRSAGLPVVTTYGMTETASGIAAAADDAAAGPGTPPLTALPGVDIDVGADTEPDPGTSRTGEITVRGPMVSPGYVSDGRLPAITSEPCTVMTGDIGTLLDDGRLVVGDRRDDLIISGGENVYPAEVEAVLVAHPHVADAVVIGRTDSRWGAVPIAAITTIDGALSDEAEIIAHCRDRLAGYKVPVEVRVVTSIPRSADGKLLRRQLHEGSEESP